MGRVIAIVSAITATAIVSYYVCQSVFSVPLLKSAVAIASTIAIIMAEIISIWWYFSHVKYQQQRYEQDLRGVRGTLPSGSPRKSLPPGTRTFPQTADIAGQPGNIGKQVLLFIIGLPLCDALYLWSNLDRSPPWFVLAGTQFNNGYLLAFLAITLALLIASYLGPWVALIIALSFFALDYFGLANQVPATTLPALIEYARTHMSSLVHQPASSIELPMLLGYLSVTLKYIVAGLTFPRRRDHYGRAFFLTAAVIIFSSALLGYVDVTFEGIPMSIELHDLLLPTLVHLVSLFIVLTVHLITASIQ